MATLAGHIRKRVYRRGNKSWTRFVATLELGPNEEGERERLSMSFEKERDGRTWLAEKRALWLADVRVEQDIPSVGKLLESWLEHGESVVAWSPGHLRRCRQIAGKDLVPLARIPANRLTVERVENLLAARRREGLSPSSLHLIRSALSGALTLAIRRRILPLGHNVAAIAVAPELKRKPPQFLTPEDAMRLVQVLELERLGAMFTFAMALALRPSEAIGVRWEDVDFDSGEVQIRQGIQYVEGKFYATALKTDDSERVIPLPEAIVALLRRHRKSQLEERMAATRWTESGLVFTNTRGTAVYEPQANRELKRILDHAGLPKIVFYQLRHTGATLLRSKGVDLDQLQELMGHTTIYTTRRYAQVLQPARRSAAGKMNEFLHEAFNLPATTNVSDARRNPE